MSLMRFLSSGSRGLSKGAEPMGRYRLPNGRVIPDFGARSNPFDSHALPPQGPSAPAEDVPAKAVPTQAAQSSPSLSVTGRDLPPTVMSRMQAVARRFAGVMRGVPRAITSRLPRRQSGFPTASSTPPSSDGPTQGELSLETVRVVRNDLSESDFEVVCGETTTASPVSHEPRVVPAVGDGRPLGRLAERLFGAKAD